MEKTTCSFSVWMKIVIDDLKPHEVTLTNAVSSQHVSESATLEAAGPATKADESRM